MREKLIKRLIIYIYDEDNGKIIFDSIGEAHIIFNYPTINKTYEYLITITENEVVNEVASIIGESIVKTMTYNTFAFDYTLNGEKVEAQGVWSFDKNYFDVISESNKEIKLKTKNNYIIQREEFWKKVFQTVKFGMNNVK